MGTLSTAPPRAPRRYTLLGFSDQGPQTADAKLLASPIFDACNSLERPARARIDCARARINLCHDARGFNNARVGTNSTAAAVTTNVVDRTVRRRPASC